MSSGALENEEFVAKVALKLGCDVIGENLRVELADDEVHRLVETEAAPNRAPPGRKRIRFALGRLGPRAGHCHADRLCHRIPIRRSQPSKEASREER